MVLLMLLLATAMIVYGIKLMIKNTIFYTYLLSLLHILESIPASGEQSITVCPSDVKVVISCLLSSENPWYSTPVLLLYVKML